MTLSALRLTAEAARRLRSAPTTGRVHSAFARAVNVELDGAGWVSLHAPGPVPAPFGIVCERWADGRGLAGAPVRVEAGAMVVGDGLRIELGGATVVDTTLPSPAPMPRVFRCDLAKASGHAGRGLLPVVSALLTGRPAPTGALSQVAGPALARLADATAAGVPDGCVRAARPLLGLGPGLTPAGDDVVVGWLAGLWTSGEQGRRLVAAVSRELAAAAVERTDALSRAFLLAAVDGQAAEPVWAFARHPDETRVRALLALGASSGADLLAGYLLARHALGSRATRPSCPATAPVEAGALPSGGRALPLRAWTVPSRAGTQLSGVATLPSETGTEPSEAATPPVGAVTVHSETRKPSSKAWAPPAETEDATLTAVQA